MKRFGIILLALFLTGASLNDAREANEAYRNGDYAKAEELYRKAIDSNPDNAKLYFNLGNALAEQGKAEEALRVFEEYKTMTENPQQRAMADYNIGNLHIQSKQWDKAIAAYKNALRYREADEDAKYNYELALKKKKEQQQQQNQQNNQDQNQNQNQDQQQQQNQNQQNQDRNRQQQQQNQSQQQNQDRQQQQQPRPEQISKQEAENILKALEQKEKDLLKEFKKKKKTESSNTDNEKDW